MFDSVAFFFWNGGSRLYKYKHLEKYLPEQISILCWQPQWQPALPSVADYCWLLQLQPKKQNSLCRFLDLQHCWTKRSPRSLFVQWRWRAARWRRPRPSPRMGEVHVGHRRNEVCRFSTAAGCRCD